MPSGFSFGIDGPEEPLTVEGMQGEFLAPIGKEAVQPFHGVTHTGHLPKRILARRPVGTGESQTAG